MEHFWNGELLPNLPYSSAASVLQSLQLHSAKVVSLLYLCHTYAVSLHSNERRVAVSFWKRRSNILSMVGLHPTLGLHDELALLTGSDLLLALPGVSPNPRQSASQHWFQGRQSH